MSNPDLCAKTEPNAATETLPATINNKIHITTYNGLEPLKDQALIVIQNEDIIQYCNHKNIKITDTNKLELKTIYVRSSYWVCISENTKPKLFVFDLDDFIATGDRKQKAIEFKVYSDISEKTQIYPSIQTGGVFLHNATIKRPSKRYTYKSNTR